eukprot:TRINITY_DN10906_c0_g1_i3.p1 TRINITY_DN10906_c0_g1~~TRINITY_DN10906_c0_g1_i3.p1  ORF type:complete len:357 (+),score=71.95 TRINITY_DN10906_c0_g1_i3:42-1112(+)
MAELHSTSIEDLEEQAADGGKELASALAQVEAYRAKQGQVLREMKALRAKFEEDKKQLEADKALVCEEREAVAVARRQLEDEKSKMQSANIGKNDLIGLNFGGEQVVVVKRSLLLMFENSMLARMFSGRYEDQLDRDKDGNVFLDYSPKIMTPLIEHLRLCRDSSPEETVSLPELEGGLQKSWSKMLKFFGLIDMFQATAFIGIKQNVKIDELKGWTMFFCKPYSHVITMADFVPPGGPDDGLALLVAARRSGSDTLALAAMGSIDIVTAERSEASTLFHNGTYWYCCSNKSVGFAPSGDINLTVPDTFDMKDQLRLSWRLNSKLGGYRVGAHIPLNTSTSWEKVIFVGRVRLFDD